MIQFKASEIALAVGGKLYGDGNTLVNTVTTDSRKVSDNALFIAIKGEKFDGADFLSELEGKVSVAISHRFEKLSFPLIVVEDTIDALGKLARWYASEKALPKLKISLTGSVGKTTTKEMTSLVLSQKYNTYRTQANLNNHIGVPLTLLSLEEEHDALVCEMGMSHKGEISYLTSLVESDIAIITNIGHSHIENLGSRENIRDAKLEIIEGVKSGGTLIINGDEPLFDKVLFDGKIVRVGLGEGNDVWAENILMSDTEVEYALHAFGKTDTILLPCTGKHNVVDSLFAVAAGLLSGVSIDAVKRGLLEYKSVGLRQKIYDKNGVTVIADCYNAGVESMSAALCMLGELKCSGKKVAVLADMLELGEISADAHTFIGEKCCEVKLDLLFTYGQSSEYIHKKALSMGVESYHFTSKEELAKKLSANLFQGDIVLFKASRGMKLEEIITLSGLDN